VPKYTAGIVAFRLILVRSAAAFALVDPDVGLALVGPDVEFALVGPDVNLDSFRALEWFHQKAAPTPTNTARATAARYDHLPRNRVEIGRPLVLWGGFGRTPDVGPSVFETACASATSASSTSSKRPVSKSKRLGLNSRA
jgi:hypothetical protein